MKVHCFKMRSKTD